jgi:hypothetical protein
VKLGKMVVVLDINGTKRACLLVISGCIDFWICLIGYYACEYTFCSVEKAALLPQAFI